MRDTWKYGVNQWRSSSKFLQNLEEYLRNKVKKTFSFSCKCRMELNMALTSLKELFPLPNCRRIMTIFVKLWTLLMYVLKRNMRTVSPIQTISSQKFICISIDK